MSLKALGQPSFVTVRPSGGDDTAMIQGLINQADSSIGSTIFAFAPGLYSLSSPITINKNNLIFLGPSPGYLADDGTKQTYGAKFLGTPAHTGDLFDFDVTTWKGVTMGPVNILFQDLQFSKNWTTFTNSAGTVIEAGGAAVGAAWGSTHRGSIFGMAAGLGPRTVDGLAWIHFKRCQLNNGPVHAIDLSFNAGAKCYEFLFDDCWIDRFRGCGIGLGSGSFHCRVRGSQIQDTRFNETFYDGNGAGLYSGVWDSITDTIFNYATVANNYNLIGTNQIAVVSNCFAETAQAVTQMNTAISNLGSKLRLFNFRFNSSFADRGFGTTTPTIGLSGVDVTNSNPWPVEVYITGTGTGITAYGITDPGGTLNSFTTTVSIGSKFRVDVGGKIRLTYTGSPTWLWYGLG